MENSMHLSLGPAGWLSGLQAGLQGPTGNNEPGEAGWGVWTGFGEVVTGGGLSGGDGKAGREGWLARNIEWRNRLARAGRGVGQPNRQLARRDKSEDGRFLLGQMAGGGCLRPFASKVSVGRCGWEGR